MIPLPAAPGSADNGTSTRFTREETKGHCVSKIEDFISRVTGGELLGEIVVAIIILACVAVVSHLLVKWLHHAMRRTGNAIPQSTIFVNMVRGIVWGLGICFVLDTCFNVNMTALIAALGVGGIALSLGFQDTLSNLIGGMQISFMGIIRPGDNVQVAGSKGVVQDVTWRHATIKNRSGETVIIPNSVISKNSVVHLPSPRHLNVPFVCTTAHDLDSVVEQVQRAAHETAVALCPLETEPEVIFTEISGDGIVGKVILDIEDSAQATPVSDAITRAIAPLVR